MKHCQNIVNEFADHETLSKHGQISFADHETLSKHGQISFADHETLWYITWLELVGVIQWI